MDQQKPQTCKQNKAHEEWNVSFSCYNTISERSSIIHFVKICSRHTWTWYLSDFVLQLQFHFTAWKGTLNSISYFGKQKPASQCTCQRMVRIHKYKWWHWSHSRTSRWTTPAGHQSVKKNIRKASAEISELFWNSSLLPLLGICSSWQCDKWWVMMVMQDFGNYSREDAPSLEPWDVTHAC